MSSGTRRNGRKAGHQQIRPIEEGPYKIGSRSSLRTPIKVKGTSAPLPEGRDRPQTALRCAWRTFTQDWCTSDHNASLVAADWAQRGRGISTGNTLGLLNKDPEQILNSMLTGKPGAQKWIPVEKLAIRKK